MSLVATVLFLLLDRLLDGLEIRSVVEPHGHFEATDSHRMLFVDEPVCDDLPRLFLCLDIDLGCPSRVEVGAKVPGWLTPDSSRTDGLWDGR